MTAWSRERVLALARTPASARAADRLATPQPWDGTGAHGDVLWGRCSGSAATPYQVLVDLSGPAYRCSCPSRVHPCKHALALALLWAGGGVPEAAEPDTAAGEWVAERRQRAERGRAPRAGGPVDPAAAAKRAAQRADRVRAGLDELDLWLADQVRAGLSALQRGGYGPVDGMAARMVDAQAPGVAGMLRELPARFVGEDWPARTLEHLAAIRLLVAAHRRLDELPGPLQETVRSRVGYPVAKESVLARPAVRDRWAVLGSVDVPGDRVTARRVWLRGVATGRWALLLSYAVPGAALDASVVPGETVDADLHFYPGAGQHRALVGTEHGRAEGLPELVAHGVRRAAEDYGALLAEDPWAELCPVLVSGAPAPPDGAGGVDDAARGAVRWTLRDEDGATVPLLPGVEAWPLLARSMGEPVPVFGEWTRRGFRPLSVLPHPHDPVFSTEVAA
jgi:hypothetical protein